MHNDPFMQIVSMRNVVYIGKETVSPHITTRGRMRSIHLVFAVCILVSSEFFVFPIAIIVMRSFALNDRALTLPNLFINKLHYMYIAFSYITLMTEFFLQLNIAQNCNIFHHSIFFYNIYTSLSMIQT